MSLGLSSSKNVHFLQIQREIKALTKDLKSDKSSTAEKSDKDKSSSDGKGKKRALTEEEESNDLLISLREEKVRSRLSYFSLLSYFI